MKNGSDLYAFLETFLSVRSCPGTDSHISDRTEAAERIVCGALAGIAAKTFIAPAERIKMKFQVSSKPFSWNKAAQRGWKYVNKEGFFSLWRGHSYTVLRVAPYSGFSFAIHDYSENFFKEKLGKDTLPGSYKFLAGAIGGLGGTLLTYPLDVLRVRRALGSTFQQAVAHGGMFQGLSPTLLGIVPYSGTAWLSKQTMLEKFIIWKSRSPTITESLVINAIAGLIGQFVSYPLDVVRRRMQVAGLLDGKKPSAREVWNHLLATEGFGGATKGFSLNLVKGPIALSISLTVYDLLRSFLHPPGIIQRKRKRSSSTSEKE